MREAVPARSADRLKRNIRNVYLILPRQIRDRVYWLVYLPTLCGNAVRGTAIKRRLCCWRNRRLPCTDRNSKRHFGAHSLEHSSTTRPQTRLALGVHARLAQGVRGPPERAKGRGSAARPPLGLDTPARRGIIAPARVTGGAARRKLEDARCVAYNTVSPHRPADDRGSTRRTTGRRQPAYR